MDPLHARHQHIVGSFQFLALVNCGLISFITFASLLCGRFHCDSVAQVVLREVSVGNGPCCCGVSRCLVLEGSA